MKKMGLVILAVLSLSASAQAIGLVQCAFIKAFTVEGNCNEYSEKQNEEAIKLRRAAGCLEARPDQGLFCLQIPCEDVLAESNRMNELYFPVIKYTINPVNPLMCSLYYTQPR